MCSDALNNNVRLETEACSVQTDEEITVDVEVVRSLDHVRVMRNSRGRSRHSRRSQAGRNGRSDEERENPT